MLLITDDRGGSLDFGTDCPVVRLHQKHPPHAPSATLVCHVDLNDLATVQALRDALARYRAGPSASVHFILRDHTIVSHALANALGATSIATAIEAVRRQDAGPADGGDTIVGLVTIPLSDPSPDEDIANLAASLTRIFEAALARTPIATRDMDDGVAALLRSTKAAGIGRWIEIVRRYDDATYQHCMLVAGLVAAFAADLGLSLAKQRSVVQAALLHDIGKARVPRATLNKPGPLTPAEQSVLRRHPSDGYFMLAKQTGLEPGVLDVVLHHHEMLDGSGYPDGLRREQITDMVRLVTICDIFAALVERRPYRDPMPAGAAFEILVGMGGKLDATLLDVFRSIVEATDRPRPSVAA